MPHTYLDRKPKDKSVAWFERALTAELEAVSTAGPSERNVTLNRASFALGSLIHAGLWTPDYLAEQLAAAAEAAGLGASEARSTIRSGLGAGQSKPRDVKLQDDGTEPAPRPRKTAPPQPKRRPPEPKRLPSDEVADLWDACVSVWADPEVRTYLEARGLDAAKITDRDLARSLPNGATVPSWARRAPPGARRAQPWPAGGFRLIVPMFDARGALRSVLARNVDPTATGPMKSSAPIGGGRRGLVMADSLARQILKKGDLPSWWPAAEPLRVVVAEGETDYLRWATYRGDATDSDPWIFIGIVGGSWTQNVADRLPAGAEVGLATDEDSAGQRYAKQIEKTLGSRVRARRVHYGCM